MFTLRNYCHFLVGTTSDYQWATLKHNRFKSDFDSLLKFKSRTTAKKFLKNNPKVEQMFNAWIIEVNPSDWDGTYELYTGLPCMSPNYTPN